MAGGAFASVSGGLLRSGPRGSLDTGYTSGPITDTTTTISAATHGYQTANLLVTTWDGSGNMLAPASVTVNPSTYAVTVTFSVSTTFIVRIQSDTGQQGPQGAAGSTGAPGADGRTILYGTTAPTTEGSDGDFYIWTSTNYFYGPKAGGLWPVGTSLVGPAGAGATPNTTKGDLAGFDTASARVPVGTNGQVLTADSTSGVGVAWKTQTRSSCFDLGADNAAADLMDADIGPQGRIFMVPMAVTVTEITVSANAGTPSVIVQKQNTSTATDLLSGALTTASSGGVACATTGSACLDGTAKSGTVSIITTGSANTLAAGDWIQTKAGSGFASSGAKRLSVCITYK